MGIRWYGWEITPEEARTAPRDPWPVIRLADTRHDDPNWGSPISTRSGSVCSVCSRTPDAPAGRWRAASSLVAGDVTYPYGYADGYEQYVAATDAATVREIARDLAHIDEGDVRTYAEAWGPLGIRGSWSISSPSRGPSRKTPRPRATASSTSSSKAGRHATTCLGYRTATQRAHGVTEPGAAPSQAGITSGGAASSINSTPSTISASGRVHRRSAGR